MNLQDFLAKNKAAILKRWYSGIVETYPAETSRFLKKEKDPFANPVGSTISQGIESLYDGLVRGASSTEASSFLDHVIRIRAIQGFSPSEAIGFVFLLKNAIREELGNDADDRQISKELVVLESRIDGLALSSFDIYMKCREKLYEIRSNEIRDRAFMLLEKSDYVSRVPDQEKAPENGNNNGST